MKKAMKLPAAIVVLALLGFGNAAADSKVVAKVGEMEITTQELAFAESELSREFEFGDFHQTMAFVNAVAYIAHAEDHHPDLHVGWGHCIVRYTTHAIDGLSENDFICAALIDALPSLA